MTTQEFSDQFDVLLNSYTNQALFGEDTSKAGIALDEYEKSVLLTQAQDTIVKSYFYSNLNQQGQGFDDSERRQVDFSSLVKTATLSSYDVDQSSVFDDRGIIYQMPLKTHASKGVHWKQEEIDAAQEGDPAYDKTTSDWKIQPGTPVPIPGTCDVLFILNEKLIVKNSTSDKKGTNYVIVPLNYKEYDREMSKAYAQPLKRQAWRLFQNQSAGFDILSELIPIWDISEDITNENNSVETVYKIRYVKRPDPIVLIDLPDNLSIEGVTEETQCSLNPILHSDILNKAVEIAIATRGGRITSPRQSE